MRPRRIVIMIDELQLHGVDVQMRLAIGDALERELTRLFTLPPATPYRAARIEHMAPPPIALAAEALAATLGTRLAERVHAGVASAGQPAKGRS